MPEPGLLVVGSADALARAGDLIDAHATVRATRTLRVDPGGVPGASWAVQPDTGAEALEALGGLAGIATVLVLADPVLPIAEVVDGPVLVIGGRRVPIGVMPDDPRAIQAAADVQRRARHGAAGPVVLLSSREDHVRDRAERLADSLPASGLPFRALPTRRAGRSDVVDLLGTGPGLVLYTGVAGPLGWAGYGQIQAWELDRPDTQPIGSVVSLACSTAARVGSGHGFTEEIVERGAAASALGAIREVRSVDDTMLGEALAEVLVAGASTLAELVLALPEGPALDLFRIAGDPLAPFVGAPGSRSALDRVRAPGVGDTLAPVSWSRPDDRGHRPDPFD